MRGIKFRAWDKVRRTMYYPTVHESFSVDALSGQIDTITDESSAVEVLNLTEAANWVPLQFTGLKDKNEKEIYEGDIVEASFVGASDGEEYHETIEATMHMDCGDGFVPEDPEVIGNIYENPDLLN